MLTSFFGDLVPSRRLVGGAPHGAVPPDGAEPGDGASPASGSQPPAFAATAIFDRPVPDDDDGEPGSLPSRDRGAREWVIDGSPADAIRRYFAATRADLDAASGLITLFDPVALWAPAVVKALADVGGQPVQRLLLREHASQRTLALIERIALPRRLGDALRICHADVRAAGSEAAQVPMALMERSQLAAVIVGPLAAPAVDALLGDLLRATKAPSWGCPQLLFMLPPGAVWIADKIGALEWPASVQVIVRDEALTSVSSVWNALLALWDELRPPVAAAPGNTVAGALDGTALPAAAAAPIDIDLAQPDLPAAQRARQSLAGLLLVDGLLACAVVDARSGTVIARETREDQPVDLDLAANATGQALRALRLSARAMGVNDSVDELTVSAGGRQQLLRTSTAHPDVFVLAVLDRQRADLGLARARLVEVERRLS